MKIIFSGTPEFAAASLAAVLASKHEVVAVLTQPDRPSGRGMKLVPSPVKQLATEHKIPVLQPATLKDPTIQDQLAALNADVMIVAAYGLILPKAVLEIPKYGCLNIHASLLPRWRGAAPIQRAILAGDEETGITIMQMDQGLDTGEILLKEKCKIMPDDTTTTLHDKLSKLGAKLIVEALVALKLGRLAATSQDENQATYAAKINKSESQIDWSKSATQLEREIRAYQPFPVAHTALNGTPLKVIKAQIQEKIKGDPGRILDVSKEGILVACGQGGLALKVLQRAGGKAMTCDQFVQGFPVMAGDYLV